MKGRATRAAVLLLTAVACSPAREPSPRAPSPTPTTPKQTVSSGGEAPALLIAHIEGTKRRVSQTSLGAERVWTDGAILERATELPTPITDHLRRVGAGPVPKDQMLDLLDQVEKARSRGHAATLVRDDAREFACHFDGGGVTARTNCVYANYVEARYPAAAFVVTGPYDPVLVAEGPTIRAVIMPVK